MSEPKAKRQIRLGGRIQGPGDGSSFSLERRSAFGGQTVAIPAESLTRHTCIFVRTGGAARRLTYASLRPRPTFNAERR